MIVSLNNIGKKYNKEWIFRDISLDLEMSHSYAVVGKNGSGKSTFASIIIGKKMPTEGSITWNMNQENIPVDEIYKYCSFATPYMNLIEEFSVEEMFDFHFRLKQKIEEMNIHHFLERIELPNKSHTFIKHLSTGMKQKLTLGLVFFSKTPLLIMDEPLSNLDASGVNWFFRELEHKKKDTLLIICSNNFVEYNGCEKEINIELFKS